MSEIWQRTYGNKQNLLGSCFLVFFAGIFILLGLAFTSIGILTIHEEPFILFGGIVAILVGIGLPLGILYFAKRQVILCGPQSFSVVTESRRRGKEEASYAWSEVSQTAYAEYEDQNTDGPQRKKAFFTVHTARGQAFQVRSYIKDFGEMIDLFNRMTPHLPYVWHRQSGILIAGGRYLKVARPEKPSP